MKASAAESRAELRSAKPERARKARLTGEERRARFLDVASELIVESGLESVTMERVAERSGVSKALGYGYFENSDKLLAAVFAREIGRLDEKVLSRIVNISDAAERMRRIMDTVFEVVALRGPLLARLLQSRTRGGALEAARRERQRFQENYFTQMIEQDGGVPARHAAIAAAVWLAATNGALELVLSRHIPRREIVEVFTKMVVGGTRALRTDRNSSTRR